MKPASGWDDPLKLYFASFDSYLGGGLSSSEKLTAPAVLTRDLNEWVRFNVPGHYRVRVQSGRVQRADWTDETIPLRVFSNEIELTIVAPTPAWQKSTLSSAIATLDKRTPPRPHFGFLPVSDEQDRAAATLRYLGTADAAVEMAHRLDDERHGYEYMLGLAATPAREAAISKMEQLLHDPSFAVTQTFMGALSLVALSPDVRTGRPEAEAKLRRQFEDELLRTLPEKQGKARGISAYTIVDAFGVLGRPLTAEQKRQLTEELVGSFDSLSAEKQAAVLSRWALLDEETIAPLLPKLAEQFTEAPDLHEMHTYEANQLSQAALLRWWKIDPEAARPAIIREIVRPRPRFGAETLGILPERTLPEVEGILAEHLLAGAGNDENVASLIARYASEAVEGTVAGYLESRAGKLACAVQTPLLGYLLRVDPTAAAPMLQRAMAVRGAGFSACNHNLLVELATMHNEPLLQEMAVTSLQDEDPQIASNAAHYLGKWGDATAEEPLWTRLMAWNSAWKGRQAELRSAPGEITDGTWQAELGSSLIDALGAGQGWLTDETNLDRLSGLSVTRGQRQNVEQLRRTWNEQPRQIQFGGGEFRIAQYHALNVEAAIAKLRQFPKGTEFIWEGNLRLEGEEKAFKEISKAAGANGMVVSLRPAPKSKA